MHQICMCTNELSFSKNLVLLLDENDIYINQMFISKTFLRIDLKKMKSNLLDDIKYKRPTKDTKREDTYITGLFYFISTVYLQTF